jgi:hypothetical protein
MPKRTRKPAELDENQLAHYLIGRMTEEKGPVEVKAPAKSEISRVMAAMGRKGGKIGGKARAARMTEAERSNAAALAANARWAKPKAQSH